MKDRKKYIEWFRIMWNRIADKQEEEIDVEKSFIIEEMYNEGITGVNRVYNNCFTCAYADTDIVGSMNCEKCPIDWGSSADKFMCVNLDERGRADGLHNKWLRLTQKGNLKEAAKIARKIANLPEKN